MRPWHSHTGQQRPNLVSCFNIACRWVYKIETTDRCIFHNSFVLGSFYFNVIGDSCLYLVLLQARHHFSNHHQQSANYSQIGGVVTGLPSLPPLYSDFFLSYFGQLVRCVARQMVTKCRGSVTLCAYCGFYHIFHITISPMIILMHSWYRFWSFACYGRSSPQS